MDSLKPGQGYENVPSIYVMFTAGGGLLPRDKAIDRQYIRAPDGSGLICIVYLNLDYVGEDEEGWFIHDIKCTNPYEIHYDVLRDKSLYLKTTKEGVKEMTGVFADMWRDAVKQTEYKKSVNFALSLLGDNMSADRVAHHSGLPLARVLELKAQMHQ